MTRNTWIPQAELWIGSARLIDAPGQSAPLPWVKPEAMAPASAWRPQAKAQDTRSLPARRVPTERPSGA